MNKKSVKVNNKKSIFVNTLICLFLFLLILFLFQNANKKISETEIKTFSEKLENIRIKMEQYYNTYNEKIVERYIEIDLDTLGENKYTSFAGEEIVNNKIINLISVDLEKLGLNYDGEYAYSITTNRVYKIDGQKIQDTIYYYIKYQNNIARTNLSEKFNFKVDGIGIIKSNNNYTNNGISLTIVFPNNEYNEIIKINKREVDVTKNENSYGIIYHINEGLSYKSEYELEIEYIHNGNPKIYKYNVSNIDLEKPILTFDKVTFNYNTMQNKLVGNIKNLKASDYKSGLKYIKYIDGKILENELKETFTSYGIDININESKIYPTKDICTIYVEDNAGNYTYKYIKVPTHLIK